jgi:excisionase family DNA binding protein
MNMENKNSKQFISTNELAKLLGISRIAVFKRIKTGKIKAFKVGRSFVIDKREIPEILEKSLSEAGKKEIEAAVRKTVSEYGETLRLLGRE